MRSREFSSPKRRWCGQIINQSSRVVLVALHHHGRGASDKRMKSQTTLRLGACLAANLVRTRHPAVRSLWVCAVLQWDAWGRLMQAFANTTSIRETSALSKLISSQALLCLILLPTDEAAA